MDKVFNRRNQTPVRQDLRNHPTAAEALLWSRLRGSQLGAKFRRQHGVGPYVVDFYCPELHLVLELDGDSHCTAESETRDPMREVFIERQGLRVLRFSNGDVYGSLDAVVDRIAEVVRQG